ncbi:peptidoglycan-binding domain-containing protein [Streptomyces collinus]|uniref:peptidoglycan-binding domain-containing protein n=1 Tax=Streptomyces collinus TaxID=42684 RepID=UPI00332E5A49
MTEPTGLTCPECGAPRGPDHTPSCDCTRRAADALRDTRTAEAAAAEDFDPLRIRPYVAVPGVPEDETSGGGSGATVAEAAEPQPGPAGEPGRPGGVDPLPPGREPSAGADPGTGGVAAGEEGRRSRRTVLVAAAAAGVVVVAAAGVASGLLSYHAPSRNRVAQEVRQSVPEVTAEATSPAPASPPPRHTGPARTTPPARPTPSPTLSSPSPSPSVSHGASHPASPSPSTGSPKAAPTGRPPVLRLGDEGAEVTELQLRLKQLNLYGDQVTGVFTRPVQDAVRNYQLARGIVSDDLGVYGPATRTSLEAETSPP